MTFTDWFGAEWKRKHESTSAAITRLSGEAGLSLPTIWRLVKGQPVGSSTARVMADVTGGKVPADSMQHPPAPAGDAANG